MVAEARLKIVLIPFKVVAWILKGVAWLVVNVPAAGLYIVKHRRSQKADHSDEG